MNSPGSRKLSSSMNCMRICSHTEHSTVLKNRALILLFIFIFNSLLISAYECLFPTATFSCLSRNRDVGPKNKSIGLLQTVCERRTLSGLPVKASVVIYQWVPPLDYTWGKQRRKPATLTQGMPLILADCLGDVVGEVLGNGRWGVVVLDVRAPLNCSWEGQNAEEKVLLNECNMSSQL